VEILIVDNLLSSQRENVPDDPRVAFLRGSIASDAVLREIGRDFHHVFHLATYHGNQSSIHDPLADHANNTLTTLRLFHHLAGAPGLRSLVYSSAGCTVARKTFGRAAATTEDAPLSLEQDSPYAISKVVGEFYAVYFHRRHGLPAVRVRFQNVYGPGEILGAGRWRGTPATVWRNVVPVFVYHALHGRPLPLEGGGRASRDFIHVDDICRGLVAAALRGKGGKVYNLASGQETTIRRLAETVNRLTGNRAGLTILPRRSWDRAGHRYGSTARASRALGFAARVGLEEGLAGTVAWTRDNLPLIEACIRKHRRRLAAGG
jgi:nucleoside-diphosphate-sugar epimerase